MRSSRTNRPSLARLAVGVTAIPFLVGAAALPAAAADNLKDTRPPGADRIVNTETLRWNAPRDFHIGVAVAGGGHHLDQPYPDPFPNDAEYRYVVSKEFNSLSPENQAKWEFIHPEQGVYNFEAMDAIATFAKHNRQEVRGHTLFWHSQNPAWLEQGDFSKEELRAILKDHIQTVVGRYKGQVYQWDVANEIFTDGPNPVLRTGTLAEGGNIWLRELGPEIIADAFRWAHEADPKAKLFFNDYGVESINPKSTAYYNLIQELKAQGVPVDGFAIQGHLSTRFGFPGGLQDNLQRFSDLGLETAITEIDVRMDVPVGEQPTVEQEARQASDYDRALEACLAVEGCNSFTVWGATDKYSWVPVFFTGQGFATPMTDDFDRKPAYVAMRESLAAAKQDRRVRARAATAR
jgi:endo-1,4-beta-xylanase